MRTLFSKLSIALVTIVVLMGAAFFVADRINTRVYYEELTQKLNAPIAMYVTGQRDLITAANPDLESLAELASHAMVINPTAEIYLLDTNGKILGHGLPPDTVMQTSIDLRPVQALISGSTAFPIRGDDPRSSMQKVFSAFEVRTGDTLEGYLYVVLGGQTYEQLANDIGGSYVGKAGAYVALAIIGLTALVGLLVFSLLTKRLKRLSCEMQRVSHSGFELSPEIAPPESGGDEIDQLSRSFVDMSQQIQVQIEQLTENDRLRRELVSNISHDLRTPLSAMQGYLETMIIRGNTLSDDEQSRYLEIARKHATRLGVLIGDLFELSKLDSTRMQPNIERFSLPELVQDVAQEFQLLAETKGVSVVIEASIENAFTYGDIGLIQRVLENLMRNAIRFTPQGGTVTLSIQDRANNVAIAVTDTGSGISDKDIPRIFDRFYRAVQGEEARSDSSGLGLAIVKRILDLHDSRITVKSQLDVGTSFEFELPAYQKAA
ncbi:MAG: HAMP domain-containing histidine kinase [Gammaproteobacteria bacterium]|nr:HAMP domain-containing histidine kinase [Gammaproteobacteria bacterium]